MSSLYASVCVPGLLHSGMFRASSGIFVGLCSGASRAFQASCVLRGSAGISYAWGIYCALGFSGIFHWCTLVVRHLGLPLQRGLIGPWAGRASSCLHTLPCTVGTGTGLGVDAGVAGRCAFRWSLQTAENSSGQWSLWPLM